MALREGLRNILKVCKKERKELVTEAEKKSIKTFPCISTAPHPSLPKHYIV